LLYAGFARKSVESQKKEAVMGGGGQAAAAFNVRSQEELELNSLEAQSLINYGFIQQQLGLDKEAIVQTKKGLDLLPPAFNDALGFIGHLTIASARLAQNELDAASKSLKSSVKGLAVGLLIGAAAQEHNRLSALIKERTKEKKENDKMEEKSKFKNAFGKK